MRFFEFNPKEKPQWTLIPEDTLREVSGGGEVVLSATQGPNGVTGTVSGSVMTGRWNSTGTFGTNGHDWNTRVDLQRNAANGWQAGAWFERGQQTGASGGVVFRRRW
jgi:hypothetical protein